MATNLGLIQGTKELQGKIDSQNTTNDFLFQIGKTAGIGDFIRIDFDHNKGKGDLDLNLLTSGSSSKI
ncbi:hypothetical protein [Fortiea contorta]|uniref:hypothetical protein n=1 Tax=Fortiea contorta TaxID=1892405 RepID=UPI00034999B9|nr:hypothetical protein [Fortiea contorta]